MDEKVKEKCFVTYERFLLLKDVGSSHIFKIMHISYPRSENGAECTFFKDTSFHTK